MAKNNNQPEQDSFRSPIRDKSIVFFICLLISIFLWFLMAFSKDYNTILTFPVEYVNLPSDKVVSNVLPSSIDLEIRSSGFNLLAYKFKRTYSKIDIDMRDAKSLHQKNVFYLLSNVRIDKIKNQFNNEIHVVRIIPDTIFINFNKKVSHRVPVKSRLQLQFDKQYNLVDSVLLQPAYVTVAAEQEVIDTIKYIETEQRVLKGLNQPTVLKLGLQKPKGLTYIEISPSDVKAMINVTKFTEVNLELPIEVQNLPQGYMLKTFPDKAVVKLNVAYSDYEKITSHGFRAIVDYKKIDKGSNKLKVQLTKIPLGARNVKLITEKVEYIISK